MSEQERTAAHRHQGMMLLRPHAGSDVLAIDVLRREGLRPDSFPAALRKLQGRMPDINADASGYLLTHPATAERIEAASHAAESLCQHESQTLCVPSTFC